MKLLLCGFPIGRGSVITRIFEYRIWVKVRFQDRSVPLPLQRDGGQTVNGREIKEFSHSFGGDCDTMGC
jgi:hypothetical protein